jgi:hypothetical protein
MIFGNESLVHIDGGDYIRVAELGKLVIIAEAMGMGLDARHTLTMAIDELHATLKTEAGKEVREKL